METNNKCCNSCCFCDVKHWCNYGFQHLHLSPEMAKTYSCDHFVIKKTDNE